MADPKEVQRLEDLAYEMRKKLLNLCGHYEGAVHIGGDLSMTDLLIGLWHHALKIDPKDMKNPEPGPLHPQQGARRGVHVHRHVAPGLLRL